MPDHLLHIDSSVKGQASVSRSLSARAAAVWRAESLASAEQSIDALRSRALV